MMVNASLADDFKVDQIKAASSMTESVKTNNNTRQISWGSFEGADIYAVYLQNYVDKDSAFDNDCYYFVQKEKWSGKVDNNNIYRTTKEPYIYIKGQEKWHIKVFAITKEPIPFKFGYSDTYVEVPKYHHPQETKEVIDINNKYIEIKPNTTEWDIFTINITEVEFSYDYEVTSTSNNLRRLTEVFDKEQYITIKKNDIAKDGELVFRLSFTETSLKESPNKNANNRIFFQRRIFIYTSHYTDNNIGNWIGCWWFLHFQIFKK